MFPSNDGKKMEKYRPPASKKNDKAASLILYFKKKNGPRFFG